MEQCFRCEKTEKEVKLNDAIYENDIVKVCERCAIIEDIPVIRKPSRAQLKESERSYEVYERLKRLSGQEAREEKHESILNQIRKLDEHPELERPEEKRPFNLIENFQWHVTRARRNKGFSEKQLAWAIGESESAIKMVEKKELPEDTEKLIRKLEQFFQIKLRERTEEEIIEEQRKREERLRKAAELPREEAAKESEMEIEVSPIQPIIQEPEIEELDIVYPISEEIIDRDEQETWEEEQKPSPARILSFKSEAIRNITVQDLKELKEAKEQEERIALLEKEREKVLQANSIVKDLREDEKRKKELRQRVAEEMKDIAVGKKELEAIQEKREMLNRAVKKISKAEEEKKGVKAEERVPTISELMEKKQGKPEEKMTGDEIELQEEVAETEKSAEDLISDDFE